MKKEIILKNVQLKNVYEPVGDKKLWSVLCILTNEQNEMLVAELGVGGVQGKDSKTGEVYKNFSIYGKFFDNVPIVNKGLTKLEDGISKLQNSICDIKVYAYDWTYAKKEGKSHGILAFRIVEEGLSDLSGFDKDESAF